LARNSLIKETNAGFKEGMACDHINWHCLSLLTLYLEPDYATFLAEWVDVEQFKIRE
jgi:hypothetical protein